jgi:hypothetical protein
VSTVSGRTYTSTRVRGFAPWNPHATTLELLAKVQGILTTYEDQLPLTNRQIFYVLVGTEEFPKTEQAYARLCEYLSRARRAGMLSWDAIRDDGTVVRAAGGWYGPDHFWRAIRAAAEGYRHHPGDGQPVHVELWVEAGGMVPQAARAASPYGVDVYSAGGFNGLTDKYETAQRLGREGEDRPAIVLHMGDYDPSGCAIIDSLAEDVTAFVADMPRVAYLPEFRRIVVTPAQIDEYDLPTAPQKRTDNRGEVMDETVQAEALPPDILAAEITAALDAAVDQSVLDENRRIGAEERDRILSRDGFLAQADRWDGR